MKLLGILLILLFAWPLACKAGGRELPGVLAKVGEMEISSKDVSYRMSIEKAYGNKTVTESDALVVLVNDALDREVGRIFGISVTPDEVNALRKHVDKTTKAPEVLAKVKSIFVDDQAAYGRLYLAPRIINKKLRTWYNQSTEIHERERTLIEKSHYLAQSGKSMNEAAQASSLHFSTINYGKGKRDLPPLLKEYFSEKGKSSNNSMIAILETLSEGEIYKNIVEDDHGYMVIKLIQKNKTQYTVEAITASKRPFMKWFLEQATKVHIIILDKELEKKLASTYSNVWWVKK